MMAMTLVRASFGVLLFGTALHVSAQEIKGAVSDFALQFSPQSLSLASIMHVTGHVG